MSKADDAVTELAIGIARAMVVMANENGFPPIAMTAGAVTLGISIGLSTAIDDISAARALLRAIEGEIEVAYPNGREERANASRILRAATT